MDKYKEILRYQHAQLSQRQIATILGVSRNTVSKVINAAKATRTEWEDIRGLTEQEITSRLFPKQTKEEAFQSKPDYDELTKELRKPGVTKKLLWEEYVEGCHLTGKIPFQYTQFCHYFNQHLETSKATMHFEHQPGEKIEVDWAGQSLPIFNADTGETSKAYLFVGTLPYSQYSYVEVTGDMKQESWINAHINMFHYFKGVTTLLICDNLKTGVVKHPKKGDVVLNVQYRELADYYDTAILPAKPRKPKMKASVEGTVGKVSTSILAKLRHQVFQSVYEANQMAQELLEVFNRKNFQKREGSRADVFFAEEQPRLQRLPRVRYEYGVWKPATVQYNYHVSVDKMYYSVPYDYIKHKVNLRLTHHLVEVFYHQTRLCSHKRIKGHPGQYSTNEDHMPLHHKKVGEWNGQRFIDWASKIGKQTQTVIERLLASYKVEQQAYNGCRSILKLSDQYSSHQLEVACQKALSLIHAPRYKNIKLIIQSEATRLETTAAPLQKENLTHAILRGHDYYGKEDETK